MNFMKPAAPVEGGLFMTANDRKPVAPFYAVSLLWVLCGLLLPLYAVSHYICLAVVSAIIFFAVGRLCRVGSMETNPAPAPKTETEPAPASASGLDKMLRDGAASIAEMKRLNDNIPAPGISADIARLERASQQIFQAVRNDPSKLPQTRRFMDYYLPTTLKLLNAYDRMSHTGVSGENIDATLTKIETMIHRVAGAFEKQLDALYGSDALDISADISVLETMMAREGLSESGGKDGDIHLEL